jgi:hypothetical protein
VREDGDSGSNAIISSAMFGHPVALALCFLDGISTKRAVELLRDSASRGYITWRSVSGGSKLKKRLLWKAMPFNERQRWLQLQILILSDNLIEKNLTSDK